MHDQMSIKFYARLNLTQTKHASDNKFKTIQFVSVYGRKSAIFMKY